MSDPAVKPSMGVGWIRSRRLGALLPAFRSARLETLGRAELQRRLHAATTSVPGVAFAAAWKDGEIIVHTAGSADLRTRQPLRADTPLAWFSVTKLFTASAVMQLAEEGKLELDAPVSCYLPELRLARAGREASVRELLAHAAGLPNPVPVAWVHLASEAPPSLDETVAKHIGRAPHLKSTPGEKSAYSNLGYLLLGQIIEGVSGERFEHYVQRRLLGPLACEASGFGLGAERATAYQKRWSAMGMAARWMLDARFFDNAIEGYWALRPFAVDGAPYGGLGGPIADLLRLGQMLLAEGLGARGRVLKAESLSEMTRPFHAQQGRPQTIGLGWHLGTLEGEPYVYHIGGGGGYRAELRVYLRLGYAVAVAGNETGFDTDAFVRLLVR
mgnify:CR=1 FL=1